MRDAQTCEIYDTQADAYADLISVEEGPDADLRAFMKACPKGHVLDWGCGPGRSAALLQKFNYLVTAVDASAGMAKKASELYQIEVITEEFDALSARDTYDGIWANFSLLHAKRADMPRHLNQAHRALKESSILHLGLKEGKGEARDNLGRFYTYYEEGEIRSLLKVGGFRVESLRHGEGKGLSGDTSPFLIILARKS